MQVKIKKLRDNAVIPKLATDGAAGFDFYAVEDGECHVGQIARYPLGLSVEVPEGYALIISGRSGLGAKYGARISQGLGLIDSDYRGELSLLLCAEKPFSWKAGERICQGFIVPVIKPEFVEVDELSETNRGAGGIGSTGM